MNKMLVIAAVVILSIGCAKKQRAVTMQETVVETPRPAEKAVTVTQETPGNAESQAHVPIYFGYNSSELESESRAALTRLANALKSDSNLRLRIEGNCDERGSTEFNLALGERRAKSAQQYLVRQGVSKDQIDLVSYGEERPAAIGQGEDVWALNRRDEFHLFSN